MTNTNSITQKLCALVIGLALSSVGAVTAAEKTLPEKTLPEKAAAAFAASEWQVAAEAYAAITKAEPQNGVA